MNAERYPIDFDALKKGDTISPSKLSDIFGIDPENREYALKVLALKDEIERDLAQRGYPVTCKIEQNAIRVLTDEEAMEYNAFSFKSGMRRMFRSHVRTMQIDANQLGKEDQGKLLRQIEVQGRLIQAIREERKSFLGAIPPIPVEANAPKKSERLI